MFFNDFKFFFPEIFVVVIVCSYLLYGVFQVIKDFFLFNVVANACIYSLTIFIWLLFIQPFENIEIFLGLFSLNLFKQILCSLLAISTIVILSLISSYFFVENKNYTDTTTMSEGIFKFEHIVLIMFSLLGMLITILSNDFIMLYMGFEFQSFAFYTLASIKTNFRKSTEAGLKYFILGSFSSGLLLFGISLLYFFTGLTNFYDLRCFFSLSDNIFSIIPINLALIFILVGVFFKLPAAPFHSWVPDVYQGAPSIITAFFIIVPKITIVFVLVNVIYFVFYPFFYVSYVMLSISGLFSIFIGSFGAFFQVNIKRFLAYSTIAHAGFILLSLATISFQGIQVGIFYLFVYIILSFNFFIPFLINRFHKNYKKAETLTDLGYFMANNNMLGTSLVIYFFSIAGIPPLAGFFSKFSVFIVLFKYNMLFFLFFSFVISVISCFYYIRVIRFIYFDNVYFMNEEKIYDSNKKKDDSFFNATGSSPITAYLKNGVDRITYNNFYLFFIIFINVAFIFVFDYVFQFISFIIYSFF